ncbi:MAG: hypothetical protein EA359_04385 [Balneolaceae bacterium]|nr:MAG: hypothetical protein EA359_04385 [Balneolaceae bacterium]
MENLKYLLQNKQGSFILSVVISLIIAVTAYNQNVHDFDENEIWCALPPPEYLEQEAGNIEQVEFESIQLWDKSLGMQLGTMMIPKGWIFEQDIALNIQTGLYERYHVDLLGPQGQLIRAVNSAFYSPQIGIGFEETWRHVVQEAIRFELDQVMIGNLQQSRMLSSDSQFRKTASMMRAQGIEMEALEVPFSGWFEDQRYRGVAYVAHAVNPYLNNTGVITVKLVTSPVHLFEETIRLDSRISTTYNRNGMYERRVHHVQMEALNRQQHQHQPSSLTNYRYNYYCPPYDASFSMQPIYNEVYNNNWYDNFFGSWDTGSYNSHYGGYSANDYFLDTITGYTTFDDPYTGYQRKVEGHYRYNYTDGYGNYYGTDDPWFDPNKELNGYWYPVDPLTPGY